MLSLAVALAISGCTATSTESNKRNKESTGAEESASKDETEGQSEGEGGDNVTNVPVPIFLIDPERIGTMTAGVQELNTGNVQDTEKLASSEFKTAEAKNNDLMSILSSNQYVELIKAVQLVVNDQFGGMTLDVPNGSHLFTVRDDITAKSEYVPKLVRVEVVKGDTGAESYKLTLYCAWGLPVDSVRQCARVNFQPSTIDKTKGVIDFQGSVKSIFVPQTNDLTLHIDHATNRLLGAVRDTEKKSFEVGFDYVNPFVNNSHYLRYMNKTVAPAPVINLGLFDNLTRSRDNFLNRSIGDISLFESAEFLDPGQPGRLQNNAFLPVEDLTKFPSGEYPRSVLEDYSLYIHARKAFFADFQNPGVNLDCAQAGKIMKDVYGTDPVPANVAALGDALCATDTTDIDAIESALEQTCSDSKQAEFRIKISKGSSMLSTITIDLCGVLPSLQKNPRHYDKISFAPLSPVPDYLVQLNEELAKLPVFARSEETFKLLEGFNLELAPQKISDIK